MNRETVEAMGDVQLVDTLIDYSRQHAVEEYRCRHSEETWTAIQLMKAEIMRRFYVR